MDQKERVKYARPDGWHYHTDRYCPMLTGGDFERLKYAEVSSKTISKRNLRPCGCARSLYPLGKE